ncbi:Baculoviral IAP repeat-containing 6 [Gossypium arboreum]|uniref:Baculoviral IAP repeat-containing 6 n=1 Tax=Gossypium arboreum TaxID=29729 RepID=A0A0B0MRC1_GOSAR|nr:Baculoviral IAP repeat-containing 6 [Gossypium arboreum]
MTIQFDAAFDNSNFKSATGLVVWGLMGELLVLKSTLHNNVSSPFATEAYACLEGIKLGISMDKSVIGAIIRDIQNKKPCFQEIIFQHIYRLGNSQAHRIAKNTLDRGEISYLMGE